MVFYGGVRIVQSQNYLALISCVDYKISCARFTIVVELSSTSRFDFSVETVAYLRLYIN